MRQKLVALLLAASVLALNVMPALAAEADVTPEAVAGEETAVIEGVATASEVTSYAAGEADANGFVIENGVLTRYTGKATEVTIPEGVTSIGANAFNYCESLKSIMIPESVTSIGAGAFSACSSLESITIPSSVTSIGDMTFDRCSSLKSVTIPSSVTSIGDSAFSACSSLESITIPSSVTSIGAYAFSACSSLTSVTIPESVTSIEWSAFFGCSSLTSVTIPSSVTSIGGHAFSKTPWLEDRGNENPLVIVNHILIDGSKCKGDVVIPEGVTSIGDAAFFKGSVGIYDDNPDITSVTIPSSVTSIGAYAFSACSSLTSVIIPSSVTSIGALAFYDCSSLESITIPNSVKCIEMHTFSGCSALKSIIIPSSVTEIIVNYNEDGRGIPFLDCNNLTIYGEEGSYAQQFASTWGIPFQIYSNGTAVQNTVYLPEGATISSDKMQELISINQTQVVTIITEEGVRFTFAIGTMQDRGLKVYDFGVEIITDYSSLKNPSISGDEFVLRINYNYSGKLPGTASITIPVGEKWIGKTLYYYEITENGYSYVTKATVDANGMVTVTQDHCSDYVLTTKAPVTSPKTGEDIPVALYLAMSILAVLGIAVIVSRKFYRVGKR